MIDDTIATRSASELTAGIRDKQWSSRELLDLYLDRIDRLNGPVNAVVTLDADRARATADAADAALARGDAVGPLHGLPVTIKDAIETEGIRSTGGARELTDHVPAVDAPAVARLKDAGAIVFGKTNLPRWSADFQTYNDLFGATGNPWDVGRTTGGSSGGAAAAVAAGFTSFELGTDIGGSVRIPSHCCGTFALKPSFGVVPQRGYLSHVGGGKTDVDINVFGPITRSADDLDLLLGVLAGPEPERADAWRIDLPECEPTSLGDLRIGTWLDDPASPVESEYLGMLRAAADRLADAGARVDDDRPPVDFAQQRELFVRMIVPAMAPSLAYDQAEEQADASSGSHLAWLRAEEERAALRRTWADWFAGHDLLLLPVMTVAAFPHDHDPNMFGRTIEIDGDQRSLVSTIDWLGLIGIVGLPSAVVPIGRTAAGLPVGMQIVAPFLHDRRAVGAARFAETVLGGYEVPPGF
ncbi:MAG TPA: amidase family protein [Acidimicrobiia bacterium]|jgi:amidase